MDIDPREAHLVCHDWQCCPSDWNRDHPDDRITREEWTAYQERINEAIRRAKP